MKLPACFIVVAYEIKKTDEGVQDELNKFAAECEKNKSPIIGLTCSAGNVVDYFRHDHNTMFPYYFSDDKVLRTMIRSNPGLMLFKKGTVINMWHYNDFPMFETSLIK